MEHVVVFIDILILCFGGTGIVSLYLLQKRYEDRFTKNLLIVNSLFTAILFIHLGSLYIVTVFPDLADAVRMLFPLSFLLGVGVYIGIARTVVQAGAVPKLLYIAGAAAVVLIMSLRLYLSLAASDELLQIFRFPTTAGISLFLLIVGLGMYSTSRQMQIATVRKLARQLGLLTIIFSIVSTIFYLIRQQIPVLAGLPISLDYLFFLVWSVISFTTFLGDKEEAVSSGGYKKAGTEFAQRYKVTPRELEVINHIVDGMSNKEIADTMNVSFTTVRTHVYNIFQKTGAGSRLELLKKVQNEQKNDNA